MAHTDASELFNRSFVDFMEDLEAIGIDKVPEYPMLKASAELIAQIDKHKPASMFYRYVVKLYEEQIMRCDEDFFLTEQLSDQQNMPLVGAIKHIWRSLTDGNKTAVWRHMRVLVVLSRSAAGATA
jgi:hypothetical protein